MLEYPLSLLRTQSHFHFGHAAHIRVLFLSSVSPESWLFVSIPGVLFSAPLVIGWICHWISVGTFDRGLAVHYLLNTPVTPVAVHTLRACGH